jgi:hypothetical protein
LLLEEALAVKVMVVAVELEVLELSLKNLLLEYNIQQPLEMVVLQSLLMEQETMEMIVHSLEQEWQLSLLQVEVEEEWVPHRICVLLVDQAVVQEAVLDQIQVVQEMQVVTLQLKAVLVAIQPSEQPPVAAVQVQSVVMTVHQMVELVVLEQQIQ